MAVLTGMVAGAMVFSSFAAPEQDVKSETSEIVLNDDGWENWATVCATGFFSNANTNGEWRRGSWGGCDLQVQRREWCGEKEFRIRYRGDWHPVHKGSPVEGYNYHFYYLSETLCFRM